MKENNDKKQFTDPIQPAFEDYKTLVGTLN